MTYRQVFRVDRLLGVVVLLLRDQRPVAIEANDLLAEDRG